MIRRAPLDVEKIADLIIDVEKCIEQLKAFIAFSEQEFSADSRNYGLAEHYIRRALEGILTIGTHVLSRLPAKTQEYQDVILSLGRYGIIPQEFAEKNRKLAGYRNRLVHLYWEVSSSELLAVIKEHVSDIEEFCLYFKRLLKNPELLS